MHTEINNRSHRPQQIVDSGNGQVLSTKLGVLYAQTAPASGLPVPWAKKGSFLDLSFAEAHATDELGHTKQSGQTPAAPTLRTVLFLNWVSPSHSFYLLRTWWADE